MWWKGEEEFINAGNRIVWAGLGFFIIGLFMTIVGTGTDQPLTYHLTSAQAFGIGPISIGSVVFLLGHLRED